MRKLILALMLSVLLLGFGTAQAATSSLDNIPGGAAVIPYYIGNGWETLISIQNVAATTDVGFNTALLVHLMVYDHNSNKVVDFNVPLSEVDNWSARVYLSGGQVFLAPWNCPATLPNSPGASAGCTIQSGPITVDTAGYGLGYITAIITAIDTTGAAVNSITTLGGNVNGNPWDDPNGATFDYVAPNWLAARAAFVSSTMAFAVNAKHIQGFHNIGGLLETAVSNDFADTLPVVNVICAAGLDWNADGDILDTFTGNDDPSGAALDTWELYATLTLDSNAVAANVSDTIITDGCLRAGRHRIFGSANSWYWARYNVSPAAPLSDTTIMLFAPANTGAGNVGADSLAMNGLTYDDNEVWASFTTTPIEVPRCPYFSVTNPGGTFCSTGVNNAIGHSTFTAGEHNFSMAAPLFGFTYTVSGNYADTYPLFQEDTAVVLTNLQPVGAPVRAIFAPLVAPLAVVVDTAAGDSAVARIGAWR